MTNLVQELGREYFLQRFKGTFFKGPDDATCIMRRHPGDGEAEVDKIVGTVNKPEIESILVPDEFFSDMRVFATPELGWRSAAQGKYLARLNRNNTSYHRGVASQNIGRNVSDLTMWLANEGVISLSYYAREATLAKLVMEPEYLSLSEGLTKIGSGEILSFCISANMAVFAEGEEDMALMFNANKVGTINLRGEINCNIPFVTSVLQEQQ